MAAKPTNVPETFVQTGINLKSIVMNKEILTYKRVLQRLTASQNMQILHAIHKEIQPYVAESPGVQPVFETFDAELSILDDFVKRNPRIFETEELVEIDAARDFTVRALIAKVQYYYDFVLAGEEREEARRLVYVVKKFRNVAKKEYESETDCLRNLVNELQQTPDLLARFGMTGMVARLKQENEAFESLYDVRAQMVYDKQAKDNSTKYRLAVNRSFDNLCKVITGLLQIPVSDGEQNAIESIIDIINGQIQQATGYNTGVVAGKKEGE